MNAKTLTRDYWTLTPGERFSLILAAAARGDDAEQSRLMNVGGKITLTMRDHSPYAQAFEEVALPTLVDLLDKTTAFLEATVHYVLVRHEFVGGTRANGEQGEPPSLEDASDDVRAAGFILRTRSNGWKLFCERLNFAPYWLWDGYPGFKRLERALSLVEPVAFDIEGMAQWLNANRPMGEPLTPVASLITAEKVADAVEAQFRQRVQFWSG
jgi:hypothetical protein